MMTVSSARADESKTSTDATTVVTSASQKAPGAFRTISEVADELNVPQHVLRFWETRFFQVRPLKRGGGRRYYRPEDVALLKKIHHLLYGEGYTIRGVQKLLKGVSKAQLLKEQGLGPGAVIDTDDMVANVANQDTPQVDATSTVVETVAAKAGLSDAQRAALQSALAELKEMQTEMQKAA